MAACPDEVIISAEGLASDGLVVEAGYPQPHAFTACRPSPAPALYKALPLDIGSIRLLDLEPLKKVPRSTATSHQPLVGRLSTVSLKESPRFAAVSYVWGDKAVPSHTIACYASSSTSSVAPVDLEITVSCHAMLQQIRKTFGAVTIWVDAICINQHDDREKTTQIQFMKDIYTWAETTYIWLGEGTERTEVAMDFLRHSGTIMTRLPVAWLSALGEESRRREKARYWTGATMLDPLRRLDLVFRRRHRGVTHAHIEELLLRPWVTRVWTFQEVILSANPVVLCGDKILPWARLLNAIYCTFEDRTFSLTGPTAGLLGNTPALSRWRALANLWLKLPREVHWNGVRVRESRDLSPGASEKVPGVSASGGEEEAAIASSSSPPPSFVEALRQTRVRRGICLRLCIPMTLVTMVWSLAWLALCGYLTYLAGEDLASRLSKVQATDKYSWDDITRDRVLAWGFAGFAWFLALFISCILPTSMSIFAVFILKGLSPHRFLMEREETDREATTRQILGGIQDALRHRASEKPHDRCIGLDGILSSFGTTTKPSRPNYQEPYGETFRFLIQRLVAWQPSAIEMIVDAGTVAPPGAPSWVPCWGRLPNTRLSWRYTLGFSKCSIPAPSTGGGKLSSPPLINGNRLKLKARSCGAICLRVDFNDSLRRQQQAKKDKEKADADAHADERDVIKLLGFLKAFVQYVALPGGPMPDGYDYPKSPVFGVTHSLAPERGPSHKTVHVAGSSEFEQGYDIQQRLPEWEGPYNFSDKKEDFILLSSVYDLLQHAQRPPRAYRPPPWKNVLDAALGPPPSIAAHDGGQQQLGDVTSVPATPGDEREKEENTETETETETEKEKEKTGSNEEGGKYTATENAYEEEKKDEKEEVEAKEKEESGRNPGIGLSKQTSTATTTTALAAAALSGDFSAILFYLHTTRPGAYAFLKRLINKIAAERRCLFMLENGRIGTGMLSLRQGDEVLQLQGVPPPMALRRRNTAGAGAGCAAGAGPTTATITPTTNTTTATTIITAATAAGTSTAADVAVTASKAASQEAAATEAADAKSEEKEVEDKPEEELREYTTVGAVLVHGLMHGESATPKTCTYLDPWSSRPPPSPKQQIVDIIIV